MENDWQLNCKNIKMRLSHLYCNDILTDCTFLVSTNDGNALKILGHKLILAAASPVFHTMLYGTMKKDTIVIKDMDAVVFEQMLTYIYTDDIDVKVFNDYCSLYRAADMYMLEHLKEECMKNIVKKLDPTNCCYGYEFAILYNDSKLEEACLNIFQRNTCEVLRGNSILDASLNTIKRIYSLEILSTTKEVELFEALERYDKVNKKDDSTSNINSKSTEGNEDDQVTMKQILQQIRFLTMTPQEFSKGPAQSTLLTQDEKLALLVNICNDKKDSPMPMGFSSQVFKRKSPQKTNCYNDGYPPGYYSRSSHRSYMC